MSTLIIPSSVSPHYQETYIVGSGSKRDKDARQETGDPRRAEQSWRTVRVRGVHSRGFESG